MSLPILSTPFVGRQTEQSEIAHLLAQDTCRLLTLVGQGGVGKTRLALETARQLQASFPDGVYFIALASLTSPEQILATIAEAVGFRFYEDKDHLIQLTCYLCKQHMLLILDNFEHLLGGANILADMLAQMFNPKCIVTARERLNLSEEWVMEISGLAVPPSSDTPELETYSAIELFLHSAKRAHVLFVLDDSDKPAVVEICRLVEGLPLAIELAAAWVRTVSCQNIVQELTRGMDILQTTLRDMSPRHRSIRAVLDQSWALLAPNEQDLFKKLSVFPSLFTHEASQAIVQADWLLLSGLVEKSLVKRDLDGRYRLHDLVRQYAREKLVATPDTWHETQTRFMHHYAQWANVQFAPLKTHAQTKTLHLIEREIDNLRQAWRTAISQQACNVLDQMHFTLWYYHLLTYREHENLADWNNAIALLRQLPPTSAHQRLLGLLLAERHDLTTNKMFGLETSIEAYTLLIEHGEERDIVFGVTCMGHASLFFSPAPAVWQAQQQLQQITENALLVAESLGDEWAISQVLHVLGLLAFGKQEYQTAHEMGIRALAHAEKVGDLALIGEITGPFLGVVNQYLGDYDRALHFRNRSNEVFRQADFWMQIGWNYQGMGYIAFLQHDYPTARHYYQESLRVYMNFQTNPRRTQHIGRGLCNVAKLWASEGRTEEAVQVLRAIAIQHTDMHDLLEWADLALGEYQPQLSQQAFSQALEKAEKINLEVIAQQFLQEIVTPSVTNKTADKSPHNGLTERELDILRLLHAGRSNREIANELYFALGTVKWYLNQIYSKLQVTSRTQAIAKGREMGWLA
jgi:predicted ATPase/DNA-binding NarL/FixJ family response regulator